MNTARKILDSFDAAAARYDTAASVQAETAVELVKWAGVSKMPQDVLDIGCGTGFVSEAVARKWPHANVTALDQSPAMLAEAKRKIPRLNIVKADAISAEITARYDIIFSSMMLHWLPDPVAAIQRWQNWLKPDGKLYAAFLVNGSFMEWRNLCSTRHLQDGLWPMPQEQILDNLSGRSLIQNVPAFYPSAADFLKQLKITGASTPDSGHKPFTPSILKQVLAAAPQPFSVTYRIIYAELTAKK